jgi:hypothetical protein
LDCGLTNLVKSADETQPGGIAEEEETARRFVED